jgi:hypothetical protein
MGDGRWQIVGDERWEKGDESFEMGDGRWEMGGGKMVEMGESTSTAIAMATSGFDVDSDVDG